MRLAAVLLPLLFVSWSNEAASDDRAALAPPVASALVKPEMPNDPVVDSVARVGCIATNAIGTAFKHKSGKFLATLSVVVGCQDVVLILSDGVVINARVLAQDVHVDLALLEPSVTVSMRPLSLSQVSAAATGTAVASWGYPSGYDGLAALMVSGHMAGRSAARMASGRVVQKLAINAGLSAGQSGSPLMDQSGQVIGVICGRLSPLSDMSMAALSALENQHRDGTYTVQRPDGSTFTLSQGQIVAAVFDELRRQIQFTMGFATPIEDVRAFLLANGINP